MNRTLCFSLALSLVGTVSPTVVRAAVVQAEPVDAGQAGAQEDKLYESGTKAMDEQRWSDAVTAFDQVAAAKGKRADAALYWKAYALDKLGRTDDARSTCDSLRKMQPSSAWNKECVVLRTRNIVLDAQGLADLSRQTADINAQVNADVYSKLGQLYISPHPDPNPDPKVRVHYTRGNRVTTEDDIKILALQSLMQQEPEKALPLVKALILSDKPIEVREQALFMLSLSKQPEAQALLKEVAVSTKDPVLQRAAIEKMSIGRGKDAGPTLVTIYNASSDAEVKRAVVNGLFIAHDATRLVELARAEKDLNMKRDIVSQLALMHDAAATAYMEELLK